MQIIFFWTRTLYTEYVIYRITSHKFNFFYAMKRAIFLRHIVVQRYFKVDLNSVLQFQSCKCLDIPIKAKFIPTNWYMNSLDLKSKILKRYSKATGFPDINDTILNVSGHITHENVKAFSGQCAWFPTKIDSPIVYKLIIPEGILFPLSRRRNVERISRPIQKLRDRLQILSRSMKKKYRYPCPLNSRNFAADSVHRGYSFRKRLLYPPLSALHRSPVTDKIRPLRISDQSLIRLRYSL